MNLEQKNQRINRSIIQWLIGKENAHWLPTLWNNYEISNIYWVTDKEGKLKGKVIDDRFDDTEKLDKALGVSYESVHHKLNLAHWHLIEDDYKRLRSLFKSYQFRVEAIWSGDFDQFLPLRIALEFNQYNCLKFLWLEVPWYFEGKGVMKKYLTKILCHKYYKYLKIKYKRKIDNYKGGNNLKLNKFRKSLKFLFSSDTLVSYFEFMSFEERVQFVGEILSFRGCNIDDFQDYFTNGIDHSKPMIDILDDFKQKYDELNSKKDDFPFYYNEKTMISSPYAIYTAIYCWRNKSSFKEKFIARVIDNVSKSDIDKMVFNFFKQTHKYRKEWIKNFANGNRDALSSSYYNLSWRILKSQVYQDMIQHYN